MWSPDSWRQKSALQQPDYADSGELDRVLADLRTLPPLVTSWEILRLGDQLAEAAIGRQRVGKSSVSATSSLKPPLAGSSSFRRAIAPSASWIARRPASPTP